MMRKTLRLFVGLAILLTAVVPGSVNAVMAPRTIATGEERLDVRDGLAPLGPLTGQATALTALVREHRDVKIRWNARFGTPSSILRHDGTLTGAAEGKPESVARRWVRERAGLYGWTAAGADALRHVRTLKQPGNGPVLVLFHQRFGAFEGNQYGGSLTVALDRQNRILSVRSNVVRTPSLAAQPTLSAASAFAKVTGKATTVEGTRGAFTVLARAGFGFNHFAQRVAFPMPDGVARPAWEITWAKGIAEGYRVVVDAANGKILSRTSIVKFAGPEGRVFPNWPGSKLGGAHEMRSMAGDPKASPEGWFLQGQPLTTIGNNATTATNWAVFIAPDGPGGLRPISADGVFDYPFTDAWNLSQCGSNPISDNFQTGDTPEYAKDALPATLNLFYHHNIAHDFWYRLGFTEEAGAMQVSNFGKGEPGTEGDPLFGLVQAGALAGDIPGAEVGRDNAYAFPNPDGVPSWSGQFLFEPIPGAINAPCVDGDFDAPVIYHEYAHVVTNRWVGGEFGNLDTHHGGSMGESWGDFVALHYLYRNGLETHDSLGPYVTGNLRRGIRNYTMSRNPLRLGDIGYDVAGDEVHSDGEIWNAMLWDIRTAIARANPRNPNAGADMAMQLIADAMPISGPSPDMLDMRDAILAADKARNKGKYQDVLWKAFAIRGMGASAFSKDGNDINPRPAFDHKKASWNGRLNGKIVDSQTGKAIGGARMIVGEYEARVSALTRSGSDGSYTMLMMDGRYPLTIQAKGYGSQTTTVTVRAGRISEQTIALDPNYASAAAGASVLESSNNSTIGHPGLALDDNATSVWVTDPDNNGTTEELVIDLAGDTPVEIAAIRMNAMTLPGSGRFNALREWTLYTSLNGGEFERVASGEFRGDRFRPVAPNLAYRTWKLDKPVKATEIKIVASPQDHTSTRVEIAELQIFGSGAPITVVAEAAGKRETFHDEGTVLVPTADGLLTYNLMQEACVFPPPTQGLDAWVTEIPEKFADGTYTVDVQAVGQLPAEPRADIDVYFLSRSCKPTGSAASAAPREKGTLTQSTRYVVTESYTSMPSDIILDIEPVD